MHYQSLSATYKQCQSEDIGISRRYLSELVRTEQIPFLTSGRKILIDWDRLQEFLRAPKQPYLIASQNSIREVK